VCGFCNNGDVENVSLQCFDTTGWATRRVSVWGCIVSYPNYFLFDQVVIYVNLFLLLPRVLTLTLLTYKYYTIAIDTVSTKTNAGVIIKYNKMMIIKQ